MTAPALRRELGLRDVTLFALTCIVGVRWIAAALTVIWIALGTNLVGMRIGKWTENLGGMATWLLCTLLIACAAILWIKRGSATPLHIIPEWNWATVNSWATIAFAMTGLE